MRKYLINTLKLFDDICGPLFLRFLVLINRDRENPGSKKILIIRPGGIGDAALILPLLKELKKQDPSRQIEVLCEPRNRAVFEGAPYINRIFSYWSLADIKRLLIEEYDLVIDTEQSHYLSTFFANLIKAGKRIGFSTANRARYYDSAVLYQQDEYELFNFARLFSEVFPIQKSILFDPPYVYASKEQKKRVSDIISHIKRPLFPIFAGASIYTRRWHPIRWARVAEGLWNMGFQPVLLGSTLEKEINKQISRYSSVPLVDLASRLSIPETAEILRRAGFLVTIDSGILHIAVIEKVRTVSLFGPGIAKKWGPKGREHIIIRKELSCSPCTKFGTTPACKKGALCMRLIQVKDVLNAIERIIQNE